MEFGSVSRLFPLIILRNSGFIRSDTHVSYDSTTLSMAYIYGRFLNDDGSFKKKDPTLVDKFRFYYDQITPVFIEHGFTESEMESFYIPILKDLTMENKIYAGHNVDDRLRMALQGVRVLTNIFQIVKFTNLLYEMYVNWDKGTDPIGMLKLVKDIDSFYEWEKTYAHLIQSKRITRKTSSLIEQMVDSNTIDLSKINRISSIKKSKATLDEFWS